MEASMQPLELGRHARAHPRGALREVPGSRRARSKPDRRDHRQPERQERRKRSYAGGRTITIRAQRPEDLDGWRAALTRTSAETLHFRFFAVKREVSEKEAHYFLDIDFVKHVALVVVADEDGRPTLIGGPLLRRRRGKAEIAFGLIEEYRPKGLAPR
jgi:hypothetical protein